MAFSKAPITSNDCFISAKVKNKVVKCLIDTGSVMSAISEPLANKLKLKITACNTDVKLLSANSTPIQAIGNCDIELFIGGMNIPYTVYVLKSLSFPAILGGDFLRFTQAVISYQSQSISLFDDLIVAPLTTQSDGYSIARIAREIIIPPRTEAIVKITVPTQYKGKTCMIESYTPIHGKMLMIAHAVIKPNEAFSFARVCNVGLTPRRIACNTPIARISEITNEATISAISATYQMGAEEMPEMQGEEGCLPTHSERMKILQGMGMPLDNTNLTSEQMEKLTEMLYCNRDVFCSEMEDLPTSNLPPYELKLSDSTPIKQRQYPLSPLQAEVMEKYVTKLLKAKILEPSTSYWNAPAILVKKKNFDPLLASEVNQWRLCIDYRKNNMRIVNEFHPLTDTDEIFTQIAEQKAKYFTKFDFTLGYWQNPLSENSRDATAWGTKTRHVRWTRTPMGIKSSSFAFLNNVANCFRDLLGAHYALYVDDGLCYHKSFDEHIKFLQRIFNRLRAAKLRISPVKFEIAKEKLIFLGQQFTERGMEIDPSRFQKIRDLKAAKNIKQLRMLCGFTNFFKRHIPNYSIITAPWRMLLQKDVQYVWGPDQDQALNAIKHAMLNNVCLAYPRNDTPYVIICDASKHACGHGLYQRHEGHLRPIAFGGRSFSRTERFLGSTESELAALIHAVHTYRKYLSNGQQFILQSDNLALKYIQSLSLSSSPKLCRYSILLSHLNFVIEYRKAGDNLVADFISRYQMDGVEQIETTPESFDTHIEPYLDIDHFNYLTAIDVEQLGGPLIEELKMNTTKRPSVQYDFCAITRAQTRDNKIVPTQPKPDGETILPKQFTRNTRDNIFVEYNLRTEKERQSRKNRHKMKNLGDQTLGQKEHQSTVDSNMQQNPNDVPTPLSYDNNEIIHNTNHAQHITAQCDDAMNDFQTKNEHLITLDKQGDEPFAQAIIDFLKDGQISQNENLARRTLMQYEDYFIANDQLYHLARLPKKSRLLPLISRIEQLVVPKSLRFTIMAATHNATHWAYNKCYETARMKYYWDNMSTDFYEFCTSCLVCKQIKNPPKAKHRIHPLEVASELWGTVHIDHHTVDTNRLGPKANRSSDPYRHVLVIVDQHSGWTELFPCKSQSAAETADILFNQYILRFGCMKRLISDRGLAFCNSVMGDLMLYQGMNIAHVTTSPFWPRSNSTAELVNKSILRHIKAFCDDKTDFARHLPAIAAGINTTYNCTTQVTPYFCCFGKNYVTPLDTAMTDTVPQSLRQNCPRGLEQIAENLQILHQIVQETATASKAHVAELRNKHAKEPNFNVGDRVFVASKFMTGKVHNRKHHRNYWGPFCIAQMPTTNLAKLIHWHTQRPLKNLINVAHLVSACDERRERLIQRLSNRGPNELPIIVEEENESVALMNTIKINTPPRHSFESKLDTQLKSQAAKQFISTAHIILQDVCTHNYSMQSVSDACYKENGLTQCRPDQLHCGLITRTLTSTARTKDDDRHSSNEWQRDQSTATVDQHQQGTTARHTEPLIMLPRLVSETPTDVDRKSSTRRPAPRYRRTLPSIPCNGTVAMDYPPTTPSERVSPSRCSQGQSTLAANNDHAITIDHKEPPTARPRLSLVRPAHTAKNCTKAPIPASRGQQNTTTALPTDEYQGIAKETATVTSTPTADTNTTKKTQKFTQNKNNECYITAPAYDYGIKSVISCMKIHNNLSFRVTYFDNRKPAWVLCDVIAPTILTQYYVERFNKKEARKLQSTVKLTKVRKGNTKQ